MTAPSVAELGDRVRALLGDRAWTWQRDLGQDTDWYIDLVQHFHARLGGGLLANKEARDQLADAVWALGLHAASAEDCAEILAVPVDWVRQVWPSPDTYQN